VSATSPSGLFTTKISGSVVINGPCTFQLNPLTLSAAPLDASIKIYATVQSNPAKAYPVNSDTLTGEYNNAQGPSFTLTDDWLDGDHIGVSFADFDRYISTAGY
jgi:hypothetical protein